MGDKVYVRTTPTIQINDYQRGGGLRYEHPQSDGVMLNIDKGKYFGFTCNDIDRHQSDLNLMDNWGGDASEQMKIVVDKDILGNIYGDVSAENSGSTAGVDSQSIDLGTPGTPITLTKTNILDVIVDCGTVLDEQNVPETGRWLVLPPWAVAMVKKSDLQDASLSGDGTSILRNGRIGMIDRFTVYSSNNLTHVTDSGSTRTVNAVFGHKAGLTFASQMTQMETLKNPDDFGDLVRGLNVYGYEVIEGKYLGHLYADKG